MENTDFIQPADTIGGPLSRELHPYGGRPPKESGNLLLMSREEFIQHLVRCNPPAERTDRRRRGQ